MTRPRCHQTSGMLWCTRKSGHRKPHHYDELQPITDDDLVKQIFEIWALVHPNSHSRMGWVIPARVRERLLATVRRASDSAAGPVFVRPDAPPPPPDRLLDRPVRVDGHTILLEVL